MCDGRATAIARASRDKRYGLSGRSSRALVARWGFNADREVGRLTGVSPDEHYQSIADDINPAPIAIHQLIESYAMTAKKSSTSNVSPSAQLAAFVAKYDPAVGRLFRETRAAMRHCFPSALELVYDNYQFLAVGYSASERASDCIASLAVSPKGVALSFYYGASLPDPSGVLLGAGNQNRFIRLTGASHLAEPAVAELLRVAAAQAKTPLPTTGRGRTVIKSVSAKQRPRRVNAKKTPGRRRP